MTDNLMSFYKTTKNTTHTTDSAKQKAEALAEKAVDFEVAKLLLVRTNLNINEIALRVNPGITSAAFSARFRYHVGMSALEYRRRGRNDVSVSFGNKQRKSLTLELRANHHGDGSLYGQQSGILASSAITEVTVSHVQFNDALRGERLNFSLGDFTILEDKLGGLVHTHQLDDKREAMLYVNPRNGLLSFQQYVLPRPKQRTTMTGHAVIELDVVFRPMMATGLDLH